MMTYSEMEREINEIPKFGAKASLSNLSDYLELANHPERNLPGDSILQGQMEKVRSAHILTRF